MPPRDPNKPKTGLYHSEFCKMGPVRVTVESDVMESTYKKGQKYVMLLINGVKRTYTLDSEACETFFDQQKGNTFTMQAVGGKGEEDCEYLGEAEPEPQQAKAPPPRSAPPRQSAPPQGRPAPAASHAPPKPGANPNHNSLHFAKCHVARAAVLQRVTLRATMQLAEDWKTYSGDKSEMPLDLFQSINSSLFISAERAMVKAGASQAFYEEGVPLVVDFDTLKPPTKEEPAPAKPKKAPPKKQEAPPESDTAGQDAPPPEGVADDDVPF